MGPFGCSLQGFIYMFCPVLLSYCCVWWILFCTVMTSVGKKELLALLSLFCSMCAVRECLVVLRLGILVGSVLITKTRLFKYIENFTSKN